MCSSEIDDLHAAPDLEPYRPEAVIARMQGGGSAPALCFNLYEAPAPRAFNAR